MPCSLCGAIGTNKTTCPFNENAKKPKPDRHTNSLTSRQVKRPNSVNRQLNRPRSRQPHGQTTQQTNAIQKQKMQQQKW